MKNQVKSIEDYSFKNTDHIFFDANIWIYIFRPNNPTHLLTKKYSEAFDSILKAKSKVYIDALIVSEFINTSARMEFNLLQDKNLKFKDFRKSNAFNPIAYGIASDLKRIFNHSSRIDTKFSELAIKEVIDEYEVGDSDFNDQMITILCKQNGLTLITHDQDFSDQEINIITGNVRLLNN